MISAPLTITYDLSGLNAKLEVIRRTFAGGGADESFLSAFVKQQAGALAADIATFLPPGSRETQNQSMRLDVGSYLTSIKNAAILPNDNRGDGDIQWIAAGPTFLTGVSKADNFLQSGDSEAFDIFKQRRKSGAQGKKYIRLGTRGRQAVQRLNRALVSRHAFNRVVARVIQRAGRAKATFASTAIRLGNQRRWPAWVMNKLSEVQSEGKAVFDDAAMVGTHPEIQFGSSAPGLSDNPAMTNAIESALNKRMAVADSTLKKLLAGFTYNVNTGQVFKAKDVQDE